MASGARRGPQASGQVGELEGAAAEQIERTETLIEDRFTRHEPAEVITSMPRAAAERGVGCVSGTVTTDQYRDQLLRP